MRRRVADLMTRWHIPRTSWRSDLGLTTRQLLSAPDDVALDIRARSQRLDAVTDRAFKVSSDEAAFRTAAVGRRPYTSPPAPAPRACWAVARRRTCPKTGPRCHLINQGGCVITYGRDFGSQLFSEPALAVADADLYLRKPDDPSDEVLIAGPLLGALRTVREVERLADPVEQLPDDKPALALLDGTPRLLGPATQQLSSLRRRRTHRRTPAARPSTGSNQHCKLY